MHELLNIMKDVKSGALPVSEIPGFLVWSLRKTMWLWCGVTVLLVIWLVR